MLKTNPSSHQLLTRYNFEGIFTRISQIITYHAIQFENFAVMLVQIIEFYLKDNSLVNKFRICWKIKKIIHGHI